MADAKWDQEKLVKDINKDAVEAAKAAVPGDDGGTCNFDSAAIHLPIKRLTPQVKALVEDLEKRAGVSAHLRTNGLWKGAVLLGVPAHGQANRRTRQAVAMQKLLVARGWSSNMYYQMD